MDIISKEILANLLAEREGPCLSLYQTTHRHHPDNTQDPIRFKNLLKTLEHSLSKGYSDPKYQELLSPFRDLADDFEFWQHTLDGLAVLSAEGQSHVFRLPQSVPDFAVVADSWHIKPLLRNVQTIGRFQVLCLTRQDIHLYEGNRDELHEVEFAEDFPRTIKDALGDQLTDPYQKVSTYGLGPAGSPGTTMRHGHGGKNDEVEVDILRYFRIVDRIILDEYSQRSELPLILVALPEYQGIFRQLSNNPFLVARGLDIDPSSLKLATLHQRAWEIMEPAYQKTITELIDRFRAEHGTGQASDQPDSILRAALSGRIDTLLVDADRQVAGRLDLANQSIQFATDFSAPNVEDILDDMAEVALKHGSNVKIIPGARMPSTTGLAAIYRY